MSSFMLGWTPPIMAGVRLVKGCFMVVELVEGGGITSGAGVGAAAALDPAHLVPSQVCPARHTVAGIDCPVVLFLHCPLSKE